MKDKKPKKKFRDTGLGKFLKQKAPKILDSVGDLLPDKGVLGIVKNLIAKDDILNPVDKETALALLEYDLVELQEVTKRWSSDMSSDSWLSKNVRPVTLLFLLLNMTILVFLDSTENSFKVDSVWVDLIKSLLITVVVAYFGSRGAEKYAKIKK